MPICILACITVVYVYFRRNTNHLFRKSVKRYSARFTLFLLRREVVYHTTPYLSSHPPGQSESSVGNASAPHSYRSQAVCDFLWRIPSADTSLSERNIILPQSYEKYEIRQRNPVKNKIIPVISVRNVEPLIEFVEPILRLSCVKR